jgi:uncharacterized protein (DUF1499 family)
MRPIPLEQTVDVARRRLGATIRSMPRSRLVTSHESYLHVEFRSLILGFVDDVEFSIDEPAGFIHFRFASRVGHSDLGVNRKRMEEIRRQFELRK